VEKKLFLCKNSGRNQNLNLQKYLIVLSRKIVYNPLTYSIYEKVLWNQIKNGKKPEHIGLILDGNRRWASEHLKPPWMGHQSGADKVEDLLDWCLDLDIKSLTIYAFSMENFQRPNKEVEEIMNLLEKRLKKLLTDERIHTDRIKIKVLGRIPLLPKRIQEIIHQLEDATQNYEDHYLNMAVAYGGRAEIIDASKKIAQQVKIGKLDESEINEEVIERHLYTAHLPKPDLDLIIRTSDEERLSGFLLWQGAYSELCFIDVFWPDFRRIDLWRAIRTYQQRERRYGR
jgi:tritrans,polycis-undecaprenyl-diphosphate synthase [geranylgeranyl-diphosphate specific]